VRAESAECALVVYRETSGEAQKVLGFRVRVYTVVAVMSAVARQVYSDSRGGVVTEKSRGNKKCEEEEEAEQQNFALLASL